MTNKEIKNVAASVRQRILNQARSEKRPFNELLQYYALERFLYRLSQSSHVDSFILKGALMLRVWKAPEIRPTMDIDMLGKSSNEETKIVEQIKDILRVDTEPDGLFFDQDSIESERITEDAHYEGIRINFRGTLDKAKIKMQVDIGFGDIVFPKPEIYELPTLLDFPAPKIFCYSRESTLAEKFEAMVKLREINSRMKDFYDIWLLAKNYDFDGEQLGEAIKATFEQRQTQLPEEIIAFTDAFADQKQVQWTAFRNRLQQELIPSSFIEIVSMIREFLGPLVMTILSKQSSPGHWRAPGPWL